MYSDALLGRFLDPLHAGDLDAPDGTGRAGNATCGDVVHFAVKIADGLISEARFRTQGCATAIAASDALCELVIGSSVTAAEVLDFDDLAVKLGGVPEDRSNCATIALEALRSALEEIRPRPLPAQAG